MPDEAPVTAASGLVFSRVCMLVLMPKLPRWALRSKNRASRHELGVTELRVSARGDRAARAGRAARSQIWNGILRIGSSDSLRPCARAASRARSRGPRLAGEV